MENNFGEQASANAFSQSNNQLFAEHAARASYIGPDSGIYAHTLQPPYLHNMLEALSIEIDKERIRGEIIVSEIARMHNVMAMELVQAMGGDGFPFGFSQQMDVKSPLGFSRLGTRVEDMSMEEMKRLNGSGDINKLRLWSRVAEPRISEVLPVPNTGNKNQECIFKAKPGNDVSGSTSEVSLPTVDLSEVTSDILKKQPDGKWSCALCHVTIPNERSLNEHLQGKKHRRKLQIEGTMNLSFQEGVKPTVELMLLGKTGEACLMEWDLPQIQLQDNLDLDHLNKSQCACVEKVDWNCAICQIATHNEKTLNEHLQEKKHEVKEAVLIAEGDGKNFGVGFSTMTTTIPSVETLDPSSEEGMRFTAGPLLPMKTGEMSLNEQDLPLLKDNMNSDGLKKVQSALDQKVTWGCDLCEIVAPSERALNKHLRGKKHKLVEVGAKISSVAATKSVQVVATTNSAMEHEVKFRPETLLNRNTGETFLKEGEQSPLLENGNRRDLKTTQFALAQNVEWSCPLCQIITTSGRALGEHMQGKKHKLKEAEKNSRVEPSPMTSAKPVKVVGAVHPSTEGGLKISTEPLLRKKTREASLEEQNLLALEGNQNSNNLKKNQSMLAQKVDWNCALCKVVAPNEQALNEHLQGKKHKLTEAAAALRVEDAGEKGSIECSARTTTNLVQVAGSIDIRMDKRVKFISESLCLKKTGEANVKEKDLCPLPEKVNLDSLLENHCALSQKVKWSCPLCQIFAPNERVLKQHLEGKKHNLKMAALRAEADEKNCVHVIEPIDLSEASGKILAESFVLEKTELRDDPKLKDLKKSQFALGEKLEWSCALCQITAPSKKVMNDHLQGKKHKLKEAALITGGVRKNSGMGRFPMTATMSAVETICTEEGVQFTAEPLLAMEAGRVSIKEKDPPLLQENINSDDFKKNQSALDQKLTWNCDLCKVVAPNEQALKKHLRGKKHKLKEAGAKLSSVIAPKSIQVVETSDPRMDQGVSSTFEPLLCRNAMEEFLKERDQPPLLRNVNKCDLKKTQVALADNVELSCALCQIIAPNKRALDEHMRGKKHKLEVGKSYRVGPSPMPAAKPAHIVETIHPSIEEGVKLIAEPLLLKKTMEALEDQNLLLLQENLNPHDLEKNQSVFVEKVEWSCSPCEIFVLNERSLNEHLQGKIHKLKDGRAQEARKNYSTGFSPLTTTNSVQIAGGIDISMEEKVKLTSESLLLKETGEVDYKETDLHLFQEEQNSDNLTKNQCVSVKSLSATVAPSERALKDRCKRKKHNLKAAVLKTEADGKNCSVQLPLMTVNNFDHLAGTIDLNKESVKIFAESLVLEKTREATLNKQSLPPLQVNMKSQSTFRQTLECSCALTQVSAYNERDLNEHLQKNVCEFKKATLADGGAGENYRNGSSPMIVGKPVEAIGTIGQSTEERVRFTDDSLQLKNSGRASLEEQVLCPLEDNPNSNNLKNNQSKLLVQNADWGCSLCHIITPNERAQNEHLQGKKHKVKEAALRAEGVGKTNSFWAASMITTESVQVPGTTDPSMKEGTKFASESLLRKNDDSPPLQESLNSVDLKQIQSSIDQNVEWSCALCQIVAPNKRALNEHLHGKKHKSKEAKLVTEGAGRNSSLITDTKSVQAVGTMDETFESVWFTSDSLLHRNVGEASLMEEDIHPFQGRPNLDDLDEYCAAFAQNLEWSCALCQILTPSEQALNGHMQGKKHKLESCALC